MAIKQGMPGRRRRTHSKEFKARLVEECRVPGISMAAVAMANGVNANLLRNWVVRAEAGGIAPKPALASPKEEFIALPLVPASPGEAAGEIRIELRRGATTVSITWPSEASAQCAAWLREWLR